MADLSNRMFLNAARGDWVRLRTLVTLRWLAVLGQSAAVLTAYYLLDLRLPITACALAIATSACFNIAAQAIHPENKRLSERDTMLTLLFDIAQLSALLFLTGGLTNPFAVLILAPVTISATALRLGSTLALGAAAIVSISLLAVWRIPLRLPGGDALDAPPLVILGMWFALVIGVVFLAAYARRVTAEIFAMSQALSVTEDALSREQRLAAIGGLAAAAAHELGTPLATIKLVSKELANELDDRPELQEDVELIRKQAERCRDILREMSRGGKDDAHVKRAPVSAIIDDAAAPHADRGRRIILRLNGALAGEDDADQPVIARRPELVHGLRNLVQNAVDFASSTVWIDVEWSETELRIAIGDDGPGYTSDVLGRLGEPYVTRRRRRDGRKAPGRVGYEGMGLGLFIAKTLLQRTGAEISFANGSDAAARGGRRERQPAEFARPPGAIVEARWQLAHLVDPVGARGAANERFSLSNI